MSNTTTGSLELTFPNTQNKTPVKLNSSLRGPESSIQEVEEEPSERSPKSASGVSQSNSAGDKNAVIQAMSTLVPDEVNLRPEESKTPNTQSVPEIIAALEQIDSHMESVTKTPATSTEGAYMTSGSNLEKSPFRPMSAQRTSKIRETLPGSSNKSPQSTLRSSGAMSFGKIAYSHVRSSGYGRPSYMPQIARGSGGTSISSNRFGFNRDFMASRTSERYSSTLGSTDAYEFVASMSGVPVQQQRSSNVNFQHSSTQTGLDIPSKKEIDKLRNMLEERTAEVDHLHRQLVGVEKELEISQERYRNATDSLTRLRKTLASKSQIASSEEKRNTVELERMLSTYQQDNEKLRHRIKDIEAENTKLAIAPPGEVAHLLAEIGKYREENEELHRTVLSFRNAGDSLAKLEEELRLSKIEEENSKQQCDLLAKKVVDLENAKQHYLEQIDILRQEMLEKSLNAKSVHFQPNNDAEVSSLKAALASKENEIAELKATKPPTSAPSNDKTTKLEAAVKELEGMLVAKHPGTVPVAVLEVAAAEKALCEEKIKQLEDQIRSGGRSPVKPIIQKVEQPRQYQATAFVEKSEDDDRVALLRKHIAEQDEVISRLRKELSRVKDVHVQEQNENAKLKALLAQEKQQVAATNPKLEEMVSTLLRERAVTLKNEAKLQAEVYELNKRVEGYDQRIRDLLNQLADARSEHTPERRLFERLLERLADMERRFTRREDMLRELRTAAVLGSVPTAASTTKPQIDPEFLRNELDKLVIELNQLRQKGMHS